MNRIYFYLLAILIDTAQAVEAPNCGEAKCHCYLFDMQVNLPYFDCTDSGISYLPNFDDEIRISTTRIYLQHNNLRQVNISREQWPLLAYIDLTHNPLVTCLSLTSFKEILLPETCHTIEQTTETNVSSLSFTEQTTVLRTETSESSPSFTEQTTVSRTETSGSSPSSSPSVITRIKRAPSTKPNPVTEHLTTSTISIISTTTKSSSTALPPSAQLTTGNKTIDTVNTTSSSSRAITPTAITHTMTDDGARMIIIPACILAAVLCLITAVIYIRTRRRRRTRSSPTQSESSIIVFDRGSVMELGPVPAETPRARRSKTSEKEQ